MLSKLHKISYYDTKLTIKIFLPNILDQFKTWFDKLFKNATFQQKQLENFRNYVKVKTTYAEKNLTEMNFYAKRDSDPRLFVI